jgi:hypothetical protein
MAMQHTAVLPKSCSGSRACRPSHLHTHTTPTRRYFRAFEEVVRQAKLDGKYEAGIMDIRAEALSIQPPVLAYTWVVRVVWGGGMDGGVGGGVGCMQTRMYKCIIYIDV